MGGSVLVMFFKERTKGHIQFRANIIAIFMIANTIRLGRAFFEGIYEQQTLSYTLYALPLVLLGLYLGQKYHHKIPQKKFENAIEGLLLVSVLSLILKVAL